ncbi:hypothetical protein BO83DRAFT_342970 [Aspergillus eucalypticola CBS 122712]|uniref:Actin-like ATPase domain-containing protein n=1 Tax=Aspergillus eucalypticola (strain CBS 122712 / IBT 29274) TaxID=1448314 RepID=A0A317V2P0_ASPEC|nr:uncharacterized protein BO83DRAFT_342970 [Aspergillus eucalypticola CBS 122712]PWY67318.1 hypothetical protein BO83DRAFT_342970 [Aspergillus eucalypticola CBS 122712]
MAPRTSKMVVAIDFGMTFTSVASAHLEVGQDTFTVKTIHSWPGLTTPTSRLPSVLSYPEGDYRWGSLAYAFKPTYAWFKQLLDRQTPYNEFRDANFERVTNQTLVEPAPGKEPEQMVADFLRGVRLFLMDYLSLLLTPATTLHFWFSTPVVWGDAARMAMREAVHLSGIGSDFPGSVDFTSESESAARYILEREGDRFKTGDVFCICDVGGYTIDSASYRVFSREPVLRLTQLTESRGMSCGAMTVEMRFLDLMMDRFDKAFEKAFHREGAMTSSFMNKFADLKEKYNGTGLEWRLKLELDVIHSRFYDTRTSEVLLTPDDLVLIFQAVIDNSIHLMGAQLNEADRESYRHGGCGVKYLCVTGGFANSPYAKIRYDEFAKERDVELIIPDHPAIATASGLALLGVHNVAYIKKECARTYGLYHPDLMLTTGDNVERPIIRRIDMMQRTPPKITWLFYKDVSYEENFLYSRRFELLHAVDTIMIKTVTVYAIDKSDPEDKRNMIHPDDLERPAHVDINLSHIQLDHHPRVVRNGRTWYQVLIDVNAILCLKKGELNIEVSANGTICGHCHVLTAWG